MCHKKLRLLFSSADKLRLPFDTKTHVQTEGFNDYGNIHLPYKNQCKPTMSLTIAKRINMKIPPSTTRNVAPLPSSQQWKQMECAMTN
jgi:hypothetical protein